MLNFYERINNVFDYYKDIPCTEAKNFVDRYISRIRLFHDKQAESLDLGICYLHGLVTSMKTV